MDENEVANETFLGDAVESIVRVDPTADFAARLRQRIAGEALAPSWTWRRLTVATAVVVAVALFTTTVWWLDHRQTQTVQQQSVGSTTSAPDVSQSAETTEILPSIPVAEGRGVEKRTARPARPPAQSAVSVVLVPPAERRTFRRLLEAVQKEQFYVVAAEVPHDGPLVVPDIVIDPLTIEPIETVGK